MRTVFSLTLHNNDDLFLSHHRNKWDGHLKKKDGEDGGDWAKVKVWISTRPKPGIVRRSKSF